MGSEIDGRTDRHTDGRADGQRERRGICSILREWFLLFVQSLSISTWHKHSAPGQMQRTVAIYTHGAIEVYLSIMHMHTRYYASGKCF